MSTRERTRHREYMRAYRQPGWAEKQRKDRERLRRLRADPAWAEEERKRDRIRAKKARMLAAKAARCYNPTCLKRATTKLIRGFPGKDGEIVMRQVPYCGGC